MSDCWDRTLRLAQKVTYLQAAQEQVGFYFDKEKAEALKIYIAAEMKKLEDMVLPQLPPRKLKKSEEAFYTIPKKPFKIDGSYSELMLKFAARHQMDLNPGGGAIWNGKAITIKGGYLLPATKPMELGNQDNLKEFFLAEGWEPTYFNFQRGPDGKPLRDKHKQLIQTSPKIMEAGKMCPNLAKLHGALAQSVVTWLSYRNRGAVLEGWLDNPRPAFDGRISASVAGLTSTHRKKHSTIVNLPKADGEVLLGVEFRSLFRASEGKVLLGYDFQALEARCEAHYCWKYPGGQAYAKELIEGDIHFKTANFVFDRELLGVNRVKDDPTFKLYRQKAKTIKYASTYGASAAKLARTLGESKERGEEIYNAFWESAEPLARLKENVEKYWQYQGHEKYIVGILGAKLWVRAKHAIVNTLFQHCGSVCMDVSEVYMDQYLGGLHLGDDGRPVYKYKGYEVRRVAEVHDEAVWELDEEIAEDVAQLAMKAIRNTGTHLKLNVPLLGSYKIGATWANIH